MSVEVRRPTTLAEARDAVVASGALLFAGGGTKLGWGREAETVDAVVSTAGLRRVVVHNAADATVSVEAGTRLSDLQSALAEAGQWVAIDPVGGTDATIGGIFATDDAGPRRLAFGTLRDHVIGVTVVLADGAVARSGGFVIKNVAGYDLARLFCGSFGTLGLVAVLNLRLHPLAQRTATVRMDCGPDDAARIARDVAASGVEPVALDYAEGAVWIRLAGRAVAMRPRLDRIRAVTGTAADELEDDDAEWARLTAALSGRPGETVVRVGAAWTSMPEVHRTVAACATSAGVEATASSHVLVGAHTLRVRGAAAPAHARFVTALRARLAALRPVPGHAVVRRKPAGLDDLVDPWGDPGNAVALARRVKERLDPDRRLAPGRFVGGI